MVGEERHVEVAAAVDLEDGAGDEAVAEDFEEDGERWDVTGGVLAYE